MSELLNSLSSDNLVLLCVIMGIVALFLAVAISIEIYNSNKKYQKLLEKNKEESKLENTSSKLNIKESPDIKYVDESDVELEKTKAKIELANLREKLKKEEEEKQKLLEMNMTLSENNKKLEEEVKTAAENKEVEVETLEVDTPVVEEQVVSVEPTVEELEVEPVEEVKTEAPKITDKEKSDKLDEALKKVRAVTEDSKDTGYTYNSVSDIEILDDLYDDNEDAIISYEELKNSQTFGYTDDEMEKYEDEKDAIISFQELENLYLESQKIDVQVLKTPESEFDAKKKVVDLPELIEKNNYRSSSKVSPLYGVTKTDQEMVLEQTANLEKLNEEIRKTNEFLKTLKDLKKNLE